MCQLCVICNYNNNARARAPERVFWLITLSSSCTHEKQSMALAQLGVCVLLYWCRSLTWLYVAFFFSRWARDHFTSARALTQWSRSSAPCSKKRCNWAYTQVISGVCVLLTRRSGRQIWFDLILCFLVWFGFNGWQLQRANYYNAAFLYLHNCRRHLILLHDRSWPPLSEIKLRTRASL